MFFTCIISFLIKNLYIIINISTLQKEIETLRLYKLPTWTQLVNDRARNQIQIFLTVGMNGCYVKQSWPGGCSEWRIDTLA